MMFWSVIGIFAALLTATSFIPQIIVRLRHPALARVSLVTLVIFMLGCTLWIAYGIHLRDKIIIGANIFILSNVLFLFLLQCFQPGSKN
jgi:MtN3 and saliva related transmembrane protein